MGYRLDRRDLLLGLSALPLCAAKAGAAEKIQLISYHEEPPRVVTQGIGLTYDLASFLNRRLGDDLALEVILMPRLRLNAWLEKPQMRASTLVPWVNPRWFTPEQKAVMSFSLPMIDDPDVIVSRTDDPIDYTGPESLDGRRFAGVLGHKYHGIDELVASGRIHRQDVRSFVIAIDNLRIGRVDVSKLPLSTFNYIVAAPLRDRFHVSAIPDEDPRRHILVANERPDLLERLNALIRQLPGDTDWNSLLAAYQMSPRAPDA